MSPGDAVLDLACGRGGYGMEIARRTGARLIGIDFSTAALEAARSRIPPLGWKGGPTSAPVSCQTLAYLTARLTR